jgi:hypothetical protein
MTSRRRRPSLAERPGPAMTPCHQLGVTVVPVGYPGRHDHPVPLSCGVRRVQRHRAHRGALRRGRSPPILPGRGSPSEPLPAHHGHHARHPGAGLLPTQRAAGNSHREALRCLKRRLSDVVYRQLVTDARRNGPERTEGATIESCATGSTQPPDLRISHSRAVERPRNAPHGDQLETEGRRRSDSPLTHFAALAGH